MDVLFDILKKTVCSFWCTLYIKKPGVLFGVHKKTGCSFWCTKRTRDFFRYTKKNTQIFFGRLGRLGQRPTAPTVGGTRIRHVVQMNRLGVCSRMVMKFFSETQNAQIPADILKSYPDAAHLANLYFS